MNRKLIRKAILKEFKMLGMGDLGSGGLGVMGLGNKGKGGHPGHNAPVNHHGCDACGQSPCGCDEYEDYSHDSHQQLGQGSVSRESCCEAVLCLIECCECPETKERLRQCCEDLLRR